MKKQKCFKGLLQFIKKFDVFGVPISFNFDGQETYKSFIGGFCTIVVAIIIIGSFQSQIRNFSGKETIYFEINSSFNSTPSKLELSNTNFLFAIKVEQEPQFKFNEKPYFNIILIQANYTTSNGQTKKQMIQLEFQPCTIEQFSIFGNKIQEAYTVNSLSEYICPTNETTLYLQGAFLNKDFNFAKIQVSTCNGFTNQSKWNVTCASQSEIDSYLKQNGQFRVALYSINYVINPTLAKDYSDIYLSEDLNFLFQPGYMKQTVNVYFKQYEVNTDESLFIDQDIKTERFIYRDVERYSIENLVDIQNQNQNSALVSIYLRSDYFTEQANRSFLKIDQLFAYFGGIFNIFLLIFGIFVKWYNTTFYKLKMANRLYQYSELNSSQIQATPGDDNNQFIVELNKVNDKEYIMSKDCSNKTEYLFKCFKDYIIKSVHIYPGFKYFIYLITCKKISHTIRNQIIDRSIKQIESDCNVRVLMKKIQEIEKIKLILLDDNESKFFNFMQRPRLTLQKQFSCITSKRESSQQSAMEQLELNHFTNLLRAFKAVNQKNSDTQLCQRLLSALNENMQELLKKSREIDEENAGENRQQFPCILQCQSVQT